MIWTPVRFDVVLAQMEGVRGGRQGAAGSKFAEVLGAPPPIHRQISAKAPIDLKRCGQKSCAKQEDQMGRYRWSMGRLDVDVIRTEQRALGVVAIKAVWVLSAISVGFDQAASARTPHVFNVMRTISAALLRTSMWAAVYDPVP